VDTAGNGAGIVDLHNYRGHGNATHRRRLPIREDLRYIFTSEDRAPAAALRSVVRSLKRMDMRSLKKQIVAANLDLADTEAQQGGGRSRRILLQLRMKYMPIFRKVLSDRLGHRPAIGIASAHSRTPKRGGGRRRYDPIPEDIVRRATGDFKYATVAGMVSSASVPESSSLQTASLPPTSLARSCMPGKP